MIKHLIRTGAGFKVRIFPAQFLGQKGRWPPFKMATNQGNKRQRKKGSEKEEWAGNIKKYFVGFKTTLCPLFLGTFIKVRKLDLILGSHQLDNDITQSPKRAEQKGISHLDWAALFLVM